MPSLPSPTSRFAPLLCALAGLWLVSGAGAATQRAETSPLLCACEGKAGETKETKSATFDLQIEASLRLAYEIASSSENVTPKVTARLQRKLPNGSFVTVKTLCDLDQNGETDAKPFPAGNYKLEVTAERAIFRVAATRG